MDSMNRKYRSTPRAPAPKGDKAPAPKGDKKKLNKLGALWAGKSAGGQEYMSGIISIGEEQVRIVIFPNGFKEEDRHPDFVIYESENRDASNA